MQHRILKELERMLLSIFPGYFALETHKKISDVNDHIFF